MRSGKGANGHFNDGSLADTKNFRQTFNKSRGLG